MAFLQLGAEGGQSILHKLLENLPFLGKVWPWLAQGKGRESIPIKEFCSNINSPDHKTPLALAEQLVTFAGRQVTL